MAHMDPFGHQNVTEHTYGGDLMMGQGLSRATTGTVMMAGQQHSGGGFQGEWRNGAAGERHTTYTSERVQLDQPTSSRNISYEGHRQNSRAAGPPSYSFHEHNGQAYPYTSGMSSGLTMQHDMAGILNGTTSNDHEVEKAVYYPKLDPIMQTPPFTPSLHDTFNHPTPERSSFPGPDPTMTPPFTPSPFPFFTDAKPRRTSHSSLLGYISNTAPASSAASVPSQDLMRPEDDHVSAIDPTPAPTEEMYKCREGCNKTFEKGAFRTRHEKQHTKPHLCTYQGCNRGIRGNGFSRSDNVHDHARRVHGILRPGHRRTRAAQSARRLSTAEERQIIEAAFLIIENRAG